jgi:hypothetical protein
MAFTHRDEVTEFIAEATGDILIQTGKTEAKIKQLTSKFLAFLKPELSLDTASTLKFTLKLTSKDAKRAANITKILMTLDDIAKHANTRVVFVFDEFQEIVHFEEKTNAFQGAIRHAVERAQHVTYVFSGSKHEALRTLFTGKKNPLYELCQLMPLNLISKDYYRTYLTTMSKKRWETPIKSEVIDRLLDLTQCYPKYINALCLAFWAAKKSPTIKLIDTLWQEFLFSRKSSIRDELATLKLNERRLLKSLCFEKTKTPSSLAYSQVSLVPIASASRAIQSLKLKDFIYMDQEGYYQPIDPTYEAYFKLFG